MQKGRIDLPIRPLFCVSLLVLKVVLLFKQS